ncbi:MAG: hypothetical protein KDE14_04215 [Rhodobacteraceae bacterium]|nr:hypothetical protein [Paracoccaceae bacterium]
MAAVVIGLCSGLYSIQPAYAQRTTENAVAEAEDAFGSAVGNESIGLYSSTSARGFSPTQAGNLRIDGLYFDQAASLNARLSRGSTVHVGISAQGYAFPAPTGVIDFSLRVPGHEPAASVVVAEGALFSYARHSIEVDAQYPVVQDKLSIGGGFTYTRNNAHEVAVRDRNYNGAVIAHWTPTDAAAVTAFWSGLKTGAIGGDRPRIFLGNNPAPRFRAEDMTSPDWLYFGFRQYNRGIYGSYDFSDDWILKAGAFQSINNNPRVFNALLLNTDSSGEGDYVVEQIPARFTRSLSGEIRLTKAFAGPGHRQQFYAIARGRNRDLTFGGGQRLSFGRARLGAFPDLDEPVFQTGERTGTETHQLTGGLGYEGVWSRYGQISLGVQKTDYKRTLTRPAGTPVVGRSSPWLFNAGGAVYASQRFAIYGGYTRGLEELGAAPANAANRDEAVPAEITRQIDAGIRFQVSPKVQLVAGVFRINKPYYNLDANNVFRALGEIRHQGIEMSLAGSLTDNLTVVAGVVLLKARIFDDSAPAGTKPLTAVGPSPRLFRMNAQYKIPALEGVLLDLKIESASARYITIANTYKTPADIGVDIGVRYTTVMAGTPVRFRLQAMNVTNEFGLTAQPSGQIAPFAKRRVEFSVAADF